MTTPSVASDPKLRLRWVAASVFVGGSLMAGWQIVDDLSPGLRHPATLSTAWVSFALWAGAVAVMIPSKGADWRPGATRFRVAAFGWALAAAMFVVHVAVAFHFAHRWQHANAYNHVRESAGFGPGVYVSYLFTALWAADAVWMATKPKSYSTRPPWLGWAVHTFIVFVTFNGTVVYVHGWIRWMAVGVFFTLGVSMAATLARRRRGSG